MPDPINVRAVAAVGAEDRQRALNEVCRRALRDFYGRKVTPTLMAEAEATLRAALDDAVRAGLYVLPDGLALDRVELELDMRIKVIFKRAVPELAPGQAMFSLYEGDPGAGAQPTNEVSYTSYARVSVARSEGGWTTSNPLGVGTASGVTWPADVPVEARSTGQLQEPGEMEPRNRFEAVAAEIDDEER